LVIKVLNIIDARCNHEFYNTTSINSHVADVTWLHVPGACIIIRILYAFLVTNRIFELHLPYCMLICYNLNFIIFRLLWKFNSWIFS